MELNLVLASYHNGILKSNAAVLLSEAIVTDRNSKEHPRNKIIKKSCLYKTEMFQFLHSNGNKILKKVLTKATESINTEVIQFIPEQDFHPICSCAFCA